MLNRPRTRTLSEVDEVSISDTSDISSFGEVYDDVNSEFSRRYYRYEPTSKLQRKRKVSDYLRDIGLELATYGSGAIAGTAIGGIAALGAVSVAGITVMPIVFATGLGMAASIVLKDPINNTISKSIKKSKAKKLEYVVDIALTMTPKEIGDFFEKKFAIKNISDEVLSKSKIDRKKFHYVKNLDLMLYGCSLLDGSKPEEFRSKLAEYVRENGISTDVVFHEDIMSFAETEEEKNVHGDFLSIRRECFMEFKEQKDSDLMQLFGNEDKNALQYKSNISTGTAIQLGSTAASLLISVPFRFIPGVAALTKIGEKAATVGVSTVTKGIVGPTATKVFATKSIRPGEIGENRKFLKGVGGKYLLSFALVDKTDAEIFDIAEKFMENYEYYSGEKAQKIKGVENRFKRLYRYGTKAGKDTTLLRETARKTLKRLKRMPITLHEAYSIAEYIELAKALRNSTHEAQNMILIRMEEIKEDVMKSVNDNGDFSRWDGKKPDFNYFLNSYQLHMFALGKGSTAKERVDEFMNPEVSIGIGLDYRFEGQEEKFLGGGRFKFLVTKDPEVNSPLYGSKIKAGTVLYINELTFERAVEKIKNGDIDAAEIFDEKSGTRKLVEEKLKIAPKVFVRNKDGDCSFFNVNSTVWHRENSYSKMQSEIGDSLKAMSNNSSSKNIEEVVDKIRGLSTMAVTPKAFYKPRFYIGMGIAGKVDFDTGKYQLKAILDGSPLENEPFSDYFKSGTNLKLHGDTREEIMVSITNLREGKLSGAIESVDGKPFEEILKEMLGKNPGMTIKQLLAIAVPMPFVDNVSLSTEIAKTSEVEEEKSAADNTIKKIIEKRQRDGVRIEHATRAM